MRLQLHKLLCLKNCGELKKQGIMFHPDSPYFSVCADVVVTAPGGQIIPHEHQIPQPQWTNPNGSEESTLESTSSEPSEVPLQPDSDHVEPTSVPVETEQVQSSPLSFLPWLRPSLSRVSPPSEANPLGVLQVGQMKSQPQQ